MLVAHVINDQLLRLSYTERTSLSLAAQLEALAADLADDWSVPSWWRRRLSWRKETPATAEERKMQLEELALRAKHTAAKACKSQMRIRWHFGSHGPTGAVENWWSVAVYLDPLHQKPPYGKKSMGHYAKAGRGLAAKLFVAKRLERETLSQANLFDHLSAILFG